MNIQIISLWCFRFSVTACYSNCYEPFKISDWLVFIVFMTMYSFIHSLSALHGLWESIFVFVFFFAYVIQCSGLRFLLHFCALLLSCLDWLSVLCKLIFPDCTLFFFLCVCAILTFLVWVSDCVLFPTFVQGRGCFGVSVVCKLFLFMSIFGPPCVGGPVCSCLHLCACVYVCI